MKDYLKTALKIKYLPLLFFSISVIGCSNTDETGALYQSEKSTLLARASLSNDEIAVNPPPFTEGIFPCNDCHEFQESNPLRRNLVDFHEEISDMFDHDSQNRWCLDCHDLNNKDSLKLASGKLLDFQESYKLCGQCHGDKLRDWKVGVHGKRIGEWNGRKQYLLCVSCHNPHSPKFEPLMPEPPPVRLDEINK